MTFTQLATEILYRCGEGYQDYLSRCKELLKTNFETMMLSNEFNDKDYYGQIKIYNAVFSGDPLEVEDIDANLFRILSIKVDDVDYDFINHDVIRNLQRINAFLPNNYYYMRNGEIVFVYDEGEGETLEIKFLQKYTPETPTEADLLTVFSDNFINRSMDITVESMLREIRS